MKLLFVLLLIAVFSPSAPAGNKPGKEPFLKPASATPYLRSFFNKNRMGEAVTFTDSNKSVKAYSTRNIEFYNSVIKPIITENKSSLEKLDYANRINVLVKFIFSSYQMYIGKSFYRWGGDLLDLDDAQEKGVRFDTRFGLDCSGFTASAYEAAVDCGLLPENDSISSFSHKGFAYVAKLKGFKDSGGRNDAPNRFRPDSKEFTFLGREVFRVEKNGTPTREQIALLQPGDVVSKSGHIGIIAFIKGKPYYYESGGWVVPKNGGRPAPALKALRIFARKGTLSIRRALPDIAVPEKK